MAANSTSGPPGTDIPPAAAASPVTHAQAIDYLARRHRFRLIEALPWVLAVAAYVVFPDRMTFGSQVLVMVLFALSLGGWMGVKDVLQHLNGELTMTMRLGGVAKIADITRDHLNVG